MYPDNEKVEIRDIYYTVVEGEDDQGNPVYGEPRKLYDNKNEEE